MILSKVLPVVLPVPLCYPDDDVALDLRAILRTIYDEAFYHLSINYAETPPPPALRKEDAEWVAKVVQEAK